MNILTWVAFGGIIGIISGLRNTKKPVTSMQQNAILGIIGAIVGGFLGNILFGITTAGFNISSLAIALLGAVGLVYIARIIITRK